MVASGDEYDVRKEIYYAASIVQRYLQHLYAIYRAGVTSSDLHDQHTSAVAYGLLLRLLRANKFSLPELIHLEREIDNFFIQQRSQPQTERRIWLECVYLWDQMAARTQV